MTGQSSMTINREYQQINQPAPGYNYYQGYNYPQGQPMRNPN